KTGSTNPAHWRLVCPEFVNKEDWDRILASWMTEKWKKRSALETELGTRLTDIEFFEKLHKKDQGKGEWCDLRAEKAATKYRDIVKKKNGVDDIASIPFDDEAWA
ncbi:hypothetical protein Tco_0888903, partial [Tanacetum coccineum]